jgi:hypothetical protein
MKLDAMELGAVKLGVRALLAMLFVLPVSSVIISRVIVSSAILSSFILDSVSPSQTNRLDNCSVDPAIWIAFRGQRAPWAPPSSSPLRPQGN